MPSIFGSLSYVVIDELHAFIGTERGAQLLCQLEHFVRAPIVILFALAYPPRLGILRQLFIGSVRTDQ